VIEEHFVSDGEFSVEGMGLEEIMPGSPTPFYLYAAGIIKDKYRTIVSHFPGFEIFYSFKANPSLAICKRLLSLGACADISSMGELRAALRVGFRPENIAFVGPGKAESEIEAAVETGVYAIAAESVEELGLIEAASRKLAKPVNVLLRINTMEKPISPEMMVGGPSKFGFDEESVIDQVRGVNLETSKIIGVHVYSASQVMDTGFLSDHLTYVSDLAVNLSDQLGFELQCVDFGGGFGVPYGQGESELDFGDISRTAAQVRKRLRSTAPGCRLVFEVGRYLVAESGVFVTRALRTKHSRGICFIITDGGMNHFSRPVFMRVNHPVRILNKIGRHADTTCNIAGPICTPIDVSGKNVTLPRPEAGDIVGIFYAGAYGYTMSLVNFMSLGSPAEIMVEDGCLHIIRQPKPADHVFEGQSLP
jgi:diaminopimelate decarboxylase